MKPTCSFGSLLLLVLALAPAIAVADSAVLSNGAGDGSVQMVVGPYGSFGEVLHDTVLYDPAGPLPAANAVFASALFFGPLGQFLTTDVVELGAGLLDIPFLTTTTNTAVSEFTVAGFTINLSQTLSAPAGGVSLLTQVYGIRNNGTAPSNVTVVRYLDGDLDFDGTVNDSAGVSSDGQVAFEFDNGENPLSTTTFVGITNGGGTPVAYSVQPYGFADDIILAGGIPISKRNVIDGDSTGDRLTDVAYDVTLSLQDSLVIPPRQTVTYVTTTTFGTAVPQVLLQCETDQDCGPTNGCLAPRCEQGVCTADLLPNDTVCDDGNGCTETDRCVSGACVGQAVVCDDGNDCTEDFCDPELGCISVDEPDGTPCDDGSNCLEDSCQAGACVQSSSCLAVEVPDIQTVRAGGGKVWVHPTCIGHPGDRCTAQCFVSIAELRRAEPRAAQTVGPAVSAAAKKAKCTKKKAAAVARAEAAGRQEVEVSKAASRKIKKKGRAKLNLQLNPVGKCLLTDVDADGLPVIIEASVDSSGGGSGKLRYVVQLVKKSKKKK